MNINTVNEILESISFLSTEDQSFIVDVVKKRIEEKRRSEIVKRGMEAEKNYQDGKVTSGTVEDLMREIDND
jgi:hypothetical protein